MDVRITPGADQVLEPIGWRVGRLKNNRGKCVTCQSFATFEANPRSGSKAKCRAAFGPGRYSSLVESVRQIFEPLAAMRGGYAPGKAFDVGIGNADVEKAPQDHCFGWASRSSSSATRCSSFPASLGSRLAIKSNSTANSSNSSPPAIICNKRSRVISAFLNVP